MFQTVVLSYLLSHGMHIPCQVNIILTHLLCHYCTGRKDGLLRGIPNERVLLDNRTKRINLSFCQVLMESHNSTEILGGTLQMLVCLD